MHLIDQQIEQTIATLASSRLSTEELSNFEKAEDIIFDTLDEDPPNQLIYVRKKDGSIVYKNDLAAALGISLPITEGWHSDRISDYRVHYTNFIVGKKGVLLQVGLVLDQRHIEWKMIIWKIFFFLVLITVVFSALAYFFANQFLRPVRELANYLKEFSAKSGAAPALPSLAKHTPEVAELVDSLKTTQARWTEMLEQHESLTSRLLHEVRTPLTVIRNWIDSLSNRKDKMNIDVTLPTQEILHLDSIITDFMSWSRFEHHPEEREDLHALTPITSIRSYPLFEKLSSEIDIHDTCSAGFRVFAKPEHLRIILENLIQNAEKYRTQGKIEIFLSDTSFTVRNSSQEIPTTVVHNFGKPFNRAQSEKIGTGLGLANIVSICRIYGWHLKYEYSEGKSNFKIEF